jgi:hypothetical protein
MRKFLQVYPEAQDLARLETWAAQRGWSKSQAVRAAVRAFTRSPVEDPLLELSGDIQGLPEDASTNLRRYLGETNVAASAALIDSAGGAAALLVDRP